MPSRVHRAAWLFGAAVVAGLALRPAFGDELFVTRYMGYVMPWLLVGLLPGAVWAGLARRGALAAVLGVSAALVIVIHAPLFRPRPAIAPRPAEMLEIMSYNTWSKNDDERRIAGVIRSRAPDVVLLQETPPAVFARLTAALRDLYGERVLHWAYEPELQQAVLSRHPVEPRASMAEKGQAQQIVVHSPAGPITVFNVHPLRMGGWRYRYRQIAALLEEDVLPETSPVILAGDLNANDRSQLHGLIAERLANAHEAAGFGFGFTYPAAVRVLATFPTPPMARIDHIFFSEHFVALRAGTVEDSGGSDHRPVFAELGLKAREAHRHGGRVTGTPAGRVRSRDRGGGMVLQTIDGATEGRARCP
jgi:vancomycin resistance protein VanJ